MIRLLLFLGAASALSAYAYWVYRRLELPVPSWRGMAVARALSLIVLTAVLFDLRMPWGGGPGAGDRWALLDASASMAAGSSGGSGEAAVGSAWSAASARAEELRSQGWRVVRFGRRVEADGAGGPDAFRSRLAPALEQAMESGASQVRVLSDLRIEDPVEAQGVLATRGGPPVTFERFGEGTANAGVGDLRVADAARRGEGGRAELDVFSDGNQDSLLIEVLEEGRLVASRVVDAPAAGRLRGVAFDLPAPRGEGRVRYSARVSGAALDDYGADDETVTYANVGYTEGALVLVSLTPDWEGRYLLPVLEQVSGLPAAGYARIGPDRFATMGRASARGPSVDSTAVRRALQNSALGVVLGVGRDTDPWGRALAGRTSRLVVWPQDVEGLGAVGITATAVQRGEWYASPDLPASPIAAEMAGARLQGLPPLTGLLAVEAPAGAAVPLQVQLGGTGRPAPGALLVQGSGRRTVVPLAHGLWRWAARGGEAREAYRRLWSGAVGWLLAERTASAPDVRPMDWVVTPGEPVTWRVPEGAGPTRLTITGPIGDGATTPTDDEGGGPLVADTLLPGGESVLGSLASGTYRYRAVGPDGSDAGGGRFDVAAATREMAWPVMEPPSGDAPDVLGAEMPGLRAEGRPLRTSPWPYLLVLALLCMEWIARRRAGLR